MGHPAWSFFEIVLGSPNLQNTQDIKLNEYAGGPNTIGGSSYKTVWLGWK